MDITLNTVEDKNIPGGKVLTEIEAKQVIREAGIAVTDTRLAVTPEEALMASRKMKYPVALKIASPEIIHKTDVGGVKTGLKDSREVKKAWQEIMESVKEKCPGVKIDGVSVQPMAPPGVEVIIGALKDPQFGPVVMFGLGGIFVEVFRDIAFRLVPIEKRDAEEMLDEIKGKVLLKGYRGREPAGREALVDALLKVSALVANRPDIRELDLNPVFACRDSVLAVDARIVLEG